MVAAFKHWLSSIYLCPKATQKKLQKIQHLISIKEFTEAQKLLGPLLKKRRGNKLTKLCYIQVLHGTNQLENALQEASRSARKFPEELLFRLEEAKILVAMAKPKEALSAFRVCRPILTKEGDILLFARCYFLVKKHSKCLRILDPFLEQSENGDLILLAADCLSETNHYLQAACYYKRALTLLGQHQHIFIRLANTLRRLGNLSEAEEIFRTILEKDRQDLAAILGFGACLIERGHYQKALLFYQSSDGWNLFDARILNQAAACALKLKRYAEAQKLLEMALNSGEKTAQSLAYYGYSLECQKKWAQAEQIYLQIIHTFPDHPHGYRGLAWMFGVGVTTSLSYEEGLSMAHIALKLIADTTSWEILSACEARQGNFVRAYEIRAKLAQLDQEATGRARHHRAMRTLQKKLPLSNHLVTHTLVA